MVRDIYRNSVTGIASRPLLLALVTPCCSRRPARRGGPVALLECLRQGLDLVRPRELAISTSWYLAEDPRNRTNSSAASSPQPSSSHRRRRQDAVYPWVIYVWVVYMLLQACFQSRKKGAVDFCFDRSQVITVSAATSSRCHFADR